VCVGGWVGVGGCISPPTVPVHMCWCTYSNDRSWRSGACTYVLMYTDKGHVFHIQFYVCEDKSLCISPPTVPVHMCWCSQTKDMCFIYNSMCAKANHCVSPRLQCLYICVDVHRQTKCAYEHTNKTPRCHTKLYTIHIKLSAVHVRCTVYNYVTYTHTYMYTYTYIRYTAENSLLYI